MRVPSGTHPRVAQASTGIARVEGFFHDSADLPEKLSDERQRCGVLTDRDQLARSGAHPQRFEDGAGCALRIASLATHRILRWVDRDAAHGPQVGMNQAVAKHVAHKLAGKSVGARERGLSLTRCATGSTTRHRALSLDVVIAETPSAESLGTPDPISNAGCSKPNVSSRPMVPSARAKA